MAARRLQSGNIISLLREPGRGDSIGVECPRGAGIRLEVDEELDDLVFADAVVQAMRSCPRPIAPSAQPVSGVGRREWVC